MTISPLRTGVSACALLCAAPALASDPEAPRDDQTITVTGHRSADPEQRPGGADRVEAEQFEDKLTVSLGDALALSPGVYAQPRFGQETRLSIRGSGISRGYHMRGLTLLQDGIPINMADDNGDFQELDPQVFEAIEIYRGANALRYGSSTLGGAINAITPTGRTAQGWELRVDGGSFDTVRGKIAFGAADEIGDAFLALTGDTSSGDRRHADRRSLRFNGNAGLRLGEAAETRFYASINHIRQDLPGTLGLQTALTDPHTARASLIAGDQARDIDSIRLQNRTRFAIGGGAGTVGVFYSSKQLYHPIFQVIDQKSDGYGAFASLDYAGRISDAVGWELTLGSQARFGTTDAKQFVNLAGKRGALTAHSIQRAHTINSYAEGRLRLPHGLTLVAGTVHVAGERDVDNIRVPATSDSGSFDGFAPKFGALWEPAAGIQFYANRSRSIELPGFSELVQAPVMGFVPVDPQRAWTSEIGTRGRIGIAEWDISLYRADIDGEMLQFAIGPDIPAATFNADRTRHQGIEAGLTLDLARWARLTQVYQLNDFRFVGDPQYGDNRLPVVPEHLYRAELRLGGDRLSLSPRVEWVPRGAWADYRNTLRVEGYATLGLGARARIGERFTLFVDARNLTAKKAIGDISAVVEATPALEIFYPIERRGIYGGVRANF